MYKIFGEPFETEFFKNRTTSRLQVTLERSTVHTDRDPGVYRLVIRIGQAAQLCEVKSFTYRSDAVGQLLLPPVLSRSNLRGRCKLRLHLFAIPRVAVGIVP